MYEHLFFRSFCNTFRGFFTFASTNISTIDLHDYFNYSRFVIPMFDEFSFYLILINKHSELFELREATDAA